MEIAEEATELLDDSVGSKMTNGCQQASLESPIDVKQPATADKILALLSEIGSNQILSKDNSEFQPWFWEPLQGEVMTV